MVAALLIASLPLALDGESVNNNNTGLAILSVIALALGYLLIAALWFFVLRDRSKRGRDKHDE